MKKNNPVNNEDVTFKLKKDIDAVVVDDTVNEPDDVSIEDMANNLRKNIVDDAVVDKPHVYSEDVLEDVDVVENVDVVEDSVPQNFDIKDECLTSGDDYHNNALSLPSHTTERTLGPVGQALNFNLRDDEKTAQWGLTLSKGYTLNTTGYALSKGMYSGDWRQSVESNRGPLSCGKTNTNKVSNTKLAGKEAILRLLSHIGGASNFEIPLWHSGIWVNLDPVTDSEILELFRILNEDKINLGRYTHGAVFSNTTVFTTRRIIDFIITKIGETTYRAATNEQIDFHKVIKINDIPLLLLALCGSMYPDGFKYNRSCIYNPKKCRETVSGLVNFDKINWTDVDAFTAGQKEIMSTVLDGAIDDNILKRWTTDLNRPSSRTLDLNSVAGSKITFILKVPNYGEYVSAGTTWLDGIADTIGDSIEVDDVDARNKFIEDNARATILRQYTHYIESIGFGDGNTISESNDIEESLDVLSGDINIRDGVIKGVRDFIDDTTVSIVGIPTYTCSNCGGGQSDNEKGIYQHMLPLDMVELFFTILIERVSSVKGRDI